MIKKTHVWTGSSNVKTSTVDEIIRLSKRTFNPVVKLKIGFISSVFSLFSLFLFFWKLIWPLFVEPIFLWLSSVFWLPRYLGFACLYSKIENQILIEISSFRVKTRIVKDQILSMSKSMISLRSTIRWRKWFVSVFPSFFLSADLDLSLSTLTYQMCVFSWRHPVAALLLIPSSNHSRCGQNTLSSKSVIVTKERNLKRDLDEIDW